MESGLSDDFVSMLLRMSSASPGIDSGHLNIVIAPLPPQYFEVPGSDDALEVLGTCGALAMDISWGLSARDCAQEWDTGSMLPDLQRAVQGVCSSADDGAEED